MTKKNIFTKTSLKWIAFIMAVLFLCAAILVYILNTIVMGVREDSIVTVSELKGYNADCVIVLGARVYADGRLSLILRDRADRGIEVYATGGAKKILFSGDHGKVYYDEVNALKQHALEQGVPLDNIFLDHAGFSTYESMVRAKEVFGAQKVVIVTQRFHLYRAVYIACQLGMDAVGVDATIHQYFKSTMIKNELRENAARAKDWYYVNLSKPQPTYLGDPIDLSGSGIVTHD